MRFAARQLTRGLRGVHRYSLGYIFKHLTKKRIDNSTPKSFTRQQQRRRRRSTHTVSGGAKPRSGARGTGTPSGRPSTAPAVDASFRSQRAGSAGRRRSRGGLRRGRGDSAKSRASTRSLAVSQISVGREPAYIVGDPYQVMLQPAHTPSAAFLAASPNHHTHSHSHLTSAQQPLWPVPARALRTTGSVTPRGYVLVAVPMDKVERAQARKAARQGRSAFNAMGRARHQLYVRRFYAAVWLGSVMYLFRDEAACRAFFCGGQSSNEACGYLDLEGVVHMRRTRLDIPGATRRGKDAGTTSGDGDGDVDGDGVAGEGGDGSGGDGGDGGDDAGSEASGEEAPFANIQEPTCFHGMEVSTPHQTWTFYPDWRPLRETMQAEVRCSSVMAERAAQPVGSTARSRFLVRTLAVVCRRHSWNRTCSKRRTSSWPSTATPWRRLRHWPRR